MMMLIAKQSDDNDLSEDNGEEDDYDDDHSMDNGELDMFPGDGKCDSMTNVVEISHKNEVWVALSNGVIQIGIHLSKN